MKTKRLAVISLLLASLLILPACEIAGDTSDLTVSDTTAETMADTETEVATEDNSPTAPELPILESYRGMTPDVPYTPEFYSFGDGTCAVTNIVVNMLYEGTYTVEIPEASPEGDTVVEVSYLGATYNLPLYLTKDGYETMVGWWEEYFDRCVEQGLLDENEAKFRLDQACSYYCLKDATPYSAMELKADEIARFPLCEHIPMYTWDMASTEVEMAHISQLMAVAAPWYTAEWCYADLLSLQSMAETLGVEDPHLAECLEKHGDSLADAEAIRIPRTVTRLSDNLQTLSSLGVTRLIYAGTVADFEAIFEGQLDRITLPSPMTVVCTDGELMLDNLKIRYPALAE